MKASHNTSFTPADVENILKLGRDGYNAPEVARTYQVSPETIRKIWRGETFRELTKGGIQRFATQRASDTPTPERLQAGGHPLYSEPSPEEVAESLKRLQAGLAPNRAAEEILRELEEKREES